MKTIALLIGVFFLLSSMAYGQMSFSNEDLERYKGTSESDQGNEQKGGENGASGEGPETPQGPGVYVGDNSGTSEDPNVWCQRAQQARANISAAISNAAAAKENFETISANYRTRRIITSRQEVTDAEKQMKAADNAVDQARKALVDLEEEARRKDVHPGWLECNFN